jgi:osmotically-inducible protein OsmY
MHVGDQRSLSRDALMLGAGAAIGAGLTLLFDPRAGRTRRTAIAQRTGGATRSTWRSIGHSTRTVTRQGYGFAQKATHLREEPKPQPNDATLVDKVKTEIFRDADAPKGAVSVNAEDGFVYLRGQVTDEGTIHTLEKRARKVQGVRGVYNLLHLPGQPAPAASPRRAG